MLKTENVYQKSNFFFDFDENFIKIVKKINENVAIPS